MKRNSTHEEKQYTGKEIGNMKRYSTHEVEIINMKRNIKQEEKQYSRREIVTMKRNTTHEEIQYI